MLCCAVLLQLGELNTSQADKIGDLQQQLAQKTADYNNMVAQNASLLADNQQVCWFRLQFNGVHGMLRSHASLPTCMFMAAFIADKAYVIITLGCGLA